MQSHIDTPNTNTSKSNSLIECFFAIFLLIEKNDNKKLKSANLCFLYVGKKIDLQMSLGLFSDCFIFS